MSSYNLWRFDMTNSECLEFPSLSLFSRKLQTHKRQKAQIKLAKHYPGESLGLQSHRLIGGGCFSHYFFGVVCYIVMGKTNTWVNYSSKHKSFYKPSSQHLSPRKCVLQDVRTLTLFKQPKVWGQEALTILQPFPASFKLQKTLSWNTLRGESDIQDRAQSQMECFPFGFIWI